MKPYCCIFQAMVLTLAFNTSVLAQVPIQLTKKAQLRVEHDKAEDFMFPVVSDAEGNIYARYAVNEPRTTRIPITKISAGGDKLLRFDLDKLPDVGRGRIIRYCLDNQGRLSVLIKKENSESSVVVFERNGIIRSIIRIDFMIDPMQLAWFADGDLVIAGKAPRLGINVAGSVDSVPVVALFNAKGQFLRSIDLKDDVVPLDSAERTRPDGTIARDRLYDHSLVASVLQTSDDGNVYLMRPGKSGLIFVISPLGTVLRRLTLDTPKGASLTDIKLASGTLAAVFITHKSDEDSEIVAKSLRVYDAATGRTVSSYRLDATIPFILARYDGGTQFTFFGADDDGNVSIFAAGPS